MKKLYIILFFAIAGFIAQPVTAQNLFNLDSIRTIDITFSQPNWDYLLDSMATLNTGTGTGLGRLMGQVTIDGVQFDSCGIRYKGNSSYDAARDKNPLNLKLDYIINGQEYLGYSKIKLANGFADPTMIREALMYELSNQYMDCPKASFVKVTINGDYKGIYTNTESVDKNFLSQFFAGNDNAFFKCDPQTFEIWGNNSNLAYYPDSLIYDTLYDRKSTYGLTEFQALCYELENNPSTIDQYLDVDKVLWFHAVSNMFVHLDGYYGFAHNYYMYQAENGRWSIVLWDTNMSFGGLAWTGQTVWPVSLSDMETLDPFIYDNDPSYRPLVAQLLSQPRYRKMYVAHLRTLLEENVANDHYFTRAQYMQNIIDADVQNEPYPFYPYADFQSNIYTDQGTFFELRAGLQGLMSARETYLNGLPEFQYDRPNITSTSNVPALPTSYSTVSITAEVNNENETWLGYRHNEFDVFTRIQMFDDGLNGDGAANDGVYGATIATLGSDIQYYIYAENTDAGRFSPARAEYEFYSVTVTQDLVINELMASNTTTQTDETGEFDDWIELYNNTTSAISLNGYYLSDGAGNLTKWAFPDTTIAAGGYLIVWADGDTLQGSMHANFALSQAGESLLLYNSALSSIADEIVFPAQNTDETHGRYPNGTGPFVPMNPTFSAVNSMPIGIDAPVVDQVGVILFPNPASETVWVQFDEVTTTDLLVVDLMGKTVWQSSVRNGKTTDINVSDWQSGIYILQTADGVARKFVVQ